MCANLSSSWCWSLGFLAGASRKLAAEKKHMQFVIMQKRRNLYCYTKNTSSQCCCFVAPLRLMPEQLLAPSPGLGDRL